MNFVNDPQANVGDLSAVRGVIDDCRDLANCDKAEV